MTLTFDLLALKVVSESRVTWATSVPILVFLGLSVLDLGPMYATDVRQTVRPTDVRQKHRLMPRLLGAGHNNANVPQLINHTGKLFSASITLIVKKIFLGI